MSVTRIASRYAKSLLDLAIEENRVDQVLSDVKAFKKATENRDFYLLLKSPIINASKKGSIIKTIFEDKFDKMTIGFINIILNKGRESHLPEITEQFILQHKKYNHVSTVKVTTAAPLQEAALAKIKEQLVGSSATDDKVELITLVNPDIIGGFVIEFDDKLYDASVAHKLEKLKKEFSKNLFVKEF